MVPQGQPRIARRFSAWLANLSSLRPGGTVEFPRGTDRNLTIGIAAESGAYYYSGMSSISLKLPGHLLARLNEECRARGTTKSSLVRECLENQLGEKAIPADWPKPPPGESAYDKALPILKKAWARNRKLPRDLATNPKYMKGFGE